MSIRRMALMIAASAAIVGIGGFVVADSATLSQIAYATPNPDTTGFGFQAAIHDDESKTEVLVEGDVWTITPGTDVGGMAVAFDGNEYVGEITSRPLK